MFYDTVRTATVRSIILALICLPLLGLADVQSQSVEVIPHWKKGDTIHLQINRARVKSADGRSTITGKTHTDFRIEVLSADDDGYLLGWTAGKTTFDSPSQAEQSFLGQVVNLMNGLQIILEIDSHGAIKGVRNWKGLKAAALNQGSWVGLFTSYAPLANPRLAVVVITRGPDARKHFPAAVAGRNYRELGSRFGTPIDLPVASSQPANDAKAAELNEEEVDAEEEEIAQEEAAITEEEAKAASAAAAQSTSPQPLVNQPANTRVKPVLQSIDNKAKPANTSSQKSSVTPSSQPDNRQRRAP